jgi:hypothetical protein
MFFLLLKKLMVANYALIFFNFNLLNLFQIYSHIPIIYWTKT